MLVNLKAGASKTIAGKLHEQWQTNIAQSDHSDTGPFLRNKLSYLFFNHESVVFPFLLEPEGE
jgi:hypothetical protein